MAALLDYAFKADATATWNGGPALVRVFSVFLHRHRAVDVRRPDRVGRCALERLGVAGTVALLPGTVAPAAWARWIAGILERRVRTRRRGGGEELAVPLRLRAARSRRWRRRRSG